jgi:hypothetical protein
MLFENLFQRTGKKRGSILVVTFFLVMITAFGSIWMVTTMQDHQKLNARRMDLGRAYFAAEAGVQQVLHWGNNPEEYDNVDSAGLFYRDPDTGEFPNLTETLNEAGEYVISDELLATFASRHNFNISNIKSITLIPPNDNDPVTCLFKIRSEGITISGASRRVLAYVEPTPFDSLEVQINAGLLSLAAASQHGNGRVHWGESWSKSDFDMLTKPQSSYLDNTDAEYDPFTKYRSEGNLLFPSSWKIYNPAKPNKPGDIHDVETERFPGTDPASGNYENGFEQLIPDGVLEWPDFRSKYEIFKKQSYLHGRYYSTDENGNIYKDGVEDEAHKINFDLEFAVADRADSPYDIVFIDTIDGNPPADDNSNIATISNSGQNYGMKGIFYICANYDQAGTGKPAELDVEKPVFNADGSVSLVPWHLPEPDVGNGNYGVYLDGVFYCAGTAHFQGSPVIYGSVIAEQGYLSGGTPEIYFNYNLKAGLEISNGNVGSVFNIRLQKNF